MGVVQEARIETTRSPKNVALRGGAAQSFSVVGDPDACRPCEIRWLGSCRLVKRVWTGQYSGMLQNISKFELSVVDGIATYLTSPLTIQERLKFYARSYTREPSAYVAVLRGKALLRRSGADSLKRAHKSFEVATQLDPNYEKAHVLLGHTYFLTSRFEDCLKTANRRVTHDLTIVALQVLL